MPIIQFRNVDLVYPNGFHALKSVNLEINSGEIVAVIGRSGSGKTTLLKAINRTVQITTGEARVLDFNLTQMSSRDLRSLRRKVGFIFQQFNLVKNLTALQNVLHGRLSYVGILRSLLGFYPRSDVELASKALDSVGLAEKHNARVDSLSGGQQQRVAIARAIVQNPSIILADEPMASLDPRLAEVVLGLLQKFNRERGMTALVNLHVLELAEKYATHIIGLREGRIVFSGSPQDLDQKALDTIYEGAIS